jgi:hypothetical protein
MKTGFCHNFSHSSSSLAAGSKGLSNEVPIVPRVAVMARGMYRASMSKRFSVSKRTHWGKVNPLRKAGSNNAISWRRVGIDFSFIS